MIAVDLKPVPGPSIAHAMEVAPKKVRAAVKEWMRSDGIALTKEWRNKLTQIPRAGRGGTWSRRMGKAFTGEVRQTPNQAYATTSVHIGANIHNRPGFKSSVAGMETGYTDVTSDAMAVPIMENLEKLGINPDQYGSGNRRQSFKKVMQRFDGSDALVGQTFFRKVDGKLLVFARAGASIHPIPIFIMSRKIKVGKKFDFYGYVASKAQAISDHGADVVWKAIEGLK